MGRGIYRIGSESKTFYVGQSIDIERRITTHKGQLTYGNHANRGLQELYDDHPGMFTHWEMVEELADGVAMHPREAYWIEELGSWFNSKTPGADGPVSTPEQRERYSQARKGRPQTDEHVRRRMESSAETRASKPPQKSWSKGKTMAEDPRIKSVKWDDERRAQFIEQRTGHEVTQETREKISASVKKTMSDPEFQRVQSQRVKEGMKMSGASEKISRARRGKPPWNKGVPRTDEVKKKLSDDWAKRPTLACPHCGGSYRLLQAHITKSHKDVVQ